MEMFSKDLRNQVMKIINYEKKEMIPLTDDENKSHEKTKIMSYMQKRVLHK